MHLKNRKCVTLSFQRQKRTSASELHLNQCMCQFATDSRTSVPNVWRNICCVRPQLRDWTIIIYQRPSSLIRAYSLIVAFQFLSVYVFTPECAGVDATITQLMNRSLVICLFIYIAFIDDVMDIFDIKTWHKHNINSIKFSYFFLYTKQEAKLQSNFVQRIRACSFVKNKKAFNFLCVKFKVTWYFNPGQS